MCEMNKLIDFFVIILINVLSIYLVPANAACGGNLNETISSFTSPNYPRNYNDNLNCVWKIIGPLYSKIILVFKDFSTEKVHDYVQIFDGRSESDSSLGKFNGTNKPPDITSTSNYLTVKFISDHSVGDKGFSAEFKILRKGEKGEPGLPGPSGIQGLKGEKGEAGPTGLQGPQGLKGDRGFDGSQGPVGPPGQKGESGSPGVNGNVGEKGEQGLPGLPGNKGEPGLPGEKGEQGLSGLLGEKGEPGLSGLPGAKGIKGDRGQDGLPGPTGERGPQGMNCDKGIFDENIQEILAIVNSAFIGILIILMVIFIFRYNSKLNDLDRCSHRESTQINNYQDLRTDFINLMSLKRDGNTENE